ncbi:MAG TPA: XTP/dITP diphosphatase [Caldilineaceae bacterium]|nr:XTP/dITP diphosphatase [Caldilineaceae bacterium]
MRKLLVATHNQGKIREYQALLADLPLTVTSLKDEGVTLDVEETGATFAENAILKARSYAALTGLWTWSDDSGLEVDGLNGRPGVYSARYGGPGLTDQERYRRVLTELAATPRERWRARFRCVVAIALPGGQVYTTEGTLEGQITDSPRGEHGFGYDPIFYLPALGATLAELPPELKNRISHRGQATRAAKELLHRLLAGQPANRASTE